MDRDFIEFTNAYIECMLWSSIDDNGEPLDKNYDESHLSKELKRNIIEDCADFYYSNYDNIGVHGVKQSGHDFFLTRCGHSSGFWSRGINVAIEEVLTQQSKTYGSCDVYVGEDGLLYC